jgi:integrase
MLPCPFLRLRNLRSALVYIRSVFSLGPSPDAGVMCDPPKTPRSRRTLPLPGVVAEALAAHIAEWPPAADGSLFTTLHGLPHRHEYYGTRVFAKAVRRASLPAGTTSHDLRHHYASVLLAAGESVVAVAERLGHENATLVLTTYGHLLPDSEDRTRRAIDLAWISDGPGTDGGDRPQTSFLVSG